MVWASVDSKDMRTKLYKLINKKHSSFVYMCIRNKKEITEVQKKAIDRLISNG